jgi:hypothetical protein
MKHFRVVVTNGRYDAPVLYEDAANEEDAIQQARDRSGLSKYNSWEFMAFEYFQRRKSRHSFSH